jgi:hypothetical protein
MPKISITAKRGLELKQWPDIVEETELYEGNLLDELLEKNDRGGGSVRNVGSAPSAPEPIHHSIEDVLARQERRHVAGPKVYRRN